MQNKLFYTAINLEQRVRKDHILRKIKSYIDFDFIYNEVKDTYNFNSHESVRPSKVAVEAGRLMIQHINDCIKRNEPFAFETTLSGKGYIKKIKDWKTKEYEIIIYYLKVPSVEFAIERVKLRVAQGGHNVPEQDIIRRFERSWINFQQIYKQLADSWIVFDTSGNQPVILDESEW